MTTEVRSPLERPAVFAGALRDPNESGALSVTLSVWSDQIVMHNDDVELGEWSRDTVRIIPLDSSSYEFVAEGDRLIFIPDDRVAFEAVATPSTPAGSPKASERRRKSKASSAKKTSRSTVARIASAKPSASTTKKVKKSKKAKQPKSKKVAPSAASAVATASATSQSATKKPKRIRTRAARASDPSKAPTDASSRPWRRTKAKPAAKPKTEPTSGPAPSAQPREPVVAGVTPPGGSVATAIRQKTAAASEVEAPKKQRRSLKVRRLKVPSKGARTEAPAKGETTTAGQLKPKRWIRLIDSVRVYAVFGLDRVPVDTSLRGSEHQHTWDHRAAASSGPSKHICTICGRLKF